MAQIQNLPGVRHERLEMQIPSREIGFNARTTRYWNDILGPSVGRVATSSRGESSVSMITPEASLFAFDRRLVMLGSGDRWLDGVVALIEKTGEVDGLVYQANTGSQASGKEFRRRLGRIREAAGDRIRAAVVSEETAFFHSKTQKPRPFERATLQVHMRRLGLRVESLLHRPSYAQRHEGLEMLGIKDVFDGYQLVEHHTFDRYCLNGIKGKDYFTLQISTRAPSSTAVFEFGGIPHERVGRAVQRILLAFAPKSREISVLHSGDVGPTFGLSGQWRPKPLGLEASLWVLDIDAGGARLAITA